MRIPKRLKVGDTIGICAPSAGINKPEKQIRWDEAIKKLEALGFKVIETKSVRNDIEGRSASKEIRAREFMDLYLDPNVHAIIFAAGGDFLVEMLDFVDFEKIRNAEAKWLVGYSDITGINLPITTITDTFALVTGMLIGKRKLAPTISPKKTIEGSIGGSLMGTIVASAYYITVINPSNSLVLVILATCFLTVVGQLGDLAFSFIKREYGKKDFSNLIPGHGGILDRLDSLIFVVLAFVLLLGII